MSAFTAIVDRLGELSESELRQLSLIVQVRLGEAPSAAGQSKTGPRAAKPVPKPGKTRKGSKSRAKGNPSRKSQWATNPLYIEYSRLKKAVETQAKEAKTSFNSVDTAESRAYKLAFIQWMEAKSSFRDRKTSTNEASDSSESEGEEQARGHAGAAPVSHPSPSGSNLPVDEGKAVSLN